MGRYTVLKNSKKYMKTIVGVWEYGCICACGCTKSLTHGYVAVTICYVIGAAFIPFIPTKSTATTTSTWTHRSPTSRLPASPSRLPRLAWDP